MNTEQEKTVVSGPPVSSVVFLDQLRNSLEVTEARRTQSISRFVIEKLESAGIVPEQLRKLKASLVPERDGPYQLGRFIAKGGMGAIIEAQDQNLQRTVALKVILSGAEADIDLIQRFVTEARITGQLQHPNIVPLHELGVTKDGVVYYTMLKLDGVPLSTVLDRLRSRDPETLRRHPLPVLLTAFQKICDAMAFAHSRGVLHRDLKPENIMIGDFGEVMVMDWGLAKVVNAAPDENDTKYFTRVEKRTPIQDDTYATLAGEIKGTPRYMSPEQVSGNGSDLDERTDIYSLGAILYSILTLHPPVRGENIHEVLNNVATGAITSPTVFNSATSFRKSTQTSEDPDTPIPPPILEHCPDRRIPSSLSAVTMKALARHKERRYQTVAELQKDIEAYQHGFATSAEGAGLPKQLWLLVRRNRIGFSLAAAALLTIVGLVGWFTNRLSSALDELTETAPAFYAEARALTDEIKFARALSRINYALKLRPGEARFHAMRGNLLQSLGQYAAAAAAFESAADLDSSLPFLEQNRALSIRLRNEKKLDGTVSKSLLSELHNAMRAQRRAAEALALETRLSPNEQGHFLSWKALIARAGLRGRLTRDDDNLMQLKITNDETAELDSLQGMPLNSLDISGTQVSNLAPLLGMPLKRLILNDTQCTDIGELEHMELETLHLSGTQVESLRPLANLPLRELRMDGCRNIQDFSVLTNLSLLERLSLPADFADTNLLARLPNLRKITLGWPENGGWQQVPTLVRSAE
ncbi:MAG: protein kinase [Verrucomicrobiae bacterium]|nr:protein kinase [Verrucomicrobiae bacterium]